MKSIWSFMFNFSSLVVRLSLGWCIQKKQSVHRCNCIQYAQFTIHTDTQNKWIDLIVSLYIENSEWYFSICWNNYTQCECVLWPFDWLYCGCGYDCIYSWLCFSEMKYMYFFLAIFIKKLHFPSVHMSLYISHHLLGYNHQL